MSQQKYTPHYEYLKNKWTEKKESLHKEMVLMHRDAFLWLGRHVQNVAIGSVGALILATAHPAHAAMPTGTIVKNEELARDLDPKTFVVTDLTSVVPKEVRPLDQQEEGVISELLSSRYGFRVKAELNGKRLNRSYGFIGGEQHLARYPGDTMATHFTPHDGDLNDIPVYGSGMAPGLGGFGYFASSRSLMTEEEMLQEKYYIAVQSFLAPGFRDNVREYIEFFKYRKMLVVNPQNGKAIVVVIGDAGPAEWTGKHLGGSPEVMNYLERVDGSQKGSVLYFFIDDPEGRVSLGPVQAV